MNGRRISFGTLLAATCLLGTVSGVSVAQNEITLAFSDPTRPGRVEANVVDGGITIQGYEGSEVRILVQDDEGPVTEVPEGLTRILGNASFSASEDNNVVTIRAGWDEEAFLTIRVPFRTALVLDVTDGDVEITGVQGGVELNAADGDVTLRDVSGPVLVSALDGDIRATLSELPPQEPTSLSALDGDIDLTIPSGSMVTATLRALDGEIFTDFDIDFDGGGPADSDSRTIRGTINGGGLEVGVQAMDGDIFLRRGD